MPKFVCCLFYHLFVYSPHHRRQNVLWEPIKIVLLDLPYGCDVSCRCAWHFTSWDLAAYPCDSRFFPSFSVIFIAMCVCECVCHCIYAVVHYSNSCVASEHMCVWIFFFLFVFALLSLCTTHRTHIESVTQCRYPLGRFKEKVETNERKTKKIRWKGQ